MAFHRPDFYRGLLHEMSPGSNLTDGAIETWTHLLRAHRLEWLPDFEATLRGLNLPSDLEHLMRLAYAERPIREHCLDELYREILRRDIRRLLTIGVIERLGSTRVTPDILFRERQTLTRYRVLNQSSLEEYLEIDRSRLPRFDREAIGILEAAANFPAAPPADRIRQVFGDVDPEALDFLGALLLVDPQRFGELSRHPSSRRGILTFEDLSL